MTHHVLARPVAPRPGRTRASSAPAAAAYGELERRGEIDPLLDALLGAVDHEYRASLRSTTSSPTVRVVALAMPTSAPT